MKEAPPIPSCSATGRLQPRYEKVRGGQDCVELNVLSISVRKALPQLRMARLRLRNPSETGHGGRDPGVCKAPIWLLAASVSYTL